jgi:hypothetical protein
MLERARDHVRPKHERCLTTGFTTLVLAGGGTVPPDRQIDGMDMRHFLLGDAELGRTGMPLSTPACAPTIANHTSEGEVMNWKTPSRNSSPWACRTG